MMQKIRDVRRIQYRIHCLDSKVVSFSALLSMVYDLKKKTSDITLEVHTIRVWTSEALIALEIHTRQPK